MAFLKISFVSAFVQESLLADAGQLLDLGHIFANSTGYIAV
jgi:hypothetical protein